VTSPRGLTYDALCSLYVQYVDRKYGKATVVFDGLHLRERAGVYGPTVTFAKVKKDEFLANKENKQRFINNL